MLRGFGAWSLVTVLAGVVACGQSSGADGKGGASAPKRKEEKEVIDARKLIAIEQCEAAAGKMREYSTSHPDSAGSFLALGDALVCLALSPDIRRQDRQAWNARLREAEKAYVSASKIAPTDPTAFVSIGVVNLVLGEDGGSEWKEAGAALEAAAKLDPKNPLVANLLALVRADERSAEYAHAELATFYAKRQGQATLSPPPPSACTPSGHCEKVVLLADVMIDGRSYPAGTVIGAAGIDGDKIVFADKIHPDKKKGSGWVLQRMPKYGGYVWVRSGPLENAIVVRDRMPYLPVRPPVPLGGGGTRYSTPEEDRAYYQTIALLNEWAYEANHPQKNEQALLAKLGIIPDVVPGSVKRQSQDVTIDPHSAYPYVFTPVAYEQFMYPKRKFEASMAARLSQNVRGQDILVKAAIFTPEEKRALLAGHLFKGVPLFYAMLARGYGFEKAKVTLLDGETVIVFELGGGKDVFKNGDLESTTVPFDQGDEDDDMAGEAKEDYGEDEGDGEGAGNEE